MRLCSRLHISQPSQSPAVSGCDRNTHMLPWWQSPAKEELCVFIAWFNRPLIMHRVCSVWKHTSSRFNGRSFLFPSCALDLLKVFKAKGENENVVSSYGWKVSHSQTEEGSIKIKFKTECDSYWIYSNVPYLLQLLCLFLHFRTSNNWEMLWILMTFFGNVGNQRLFFKMGFFNL